MQSYSFFALENKTNDYIIARKCLYHPWHKYLKVKLRFLRQIFVEIVALKLTFGEHTSYLIQ